MWLRMANEQRLYDLSDRLIRAISNWQTFSGDDDDDVEQLIERGLFLIVLFNQLFMYMPLLIYTQI